MRIFYVCSYGGCASKMLCRFLSKYYKVFHIHSRFPPKKLCSIKRTNMSKKKEWFDYNNILKKNYNITVIYLYRKPSTSLLSNAGWGPTHFSNINLDIKKLDKFYSKNETIRLKYSKIKKDLFGLNNFFKNYVIRNYNTNYKIYCLKYETLWDNLEQIFNVLKIPKILIKKFPNKYEKNLSVIQKATKKNLEKKYMILEKYMDKLPPIFIITPKK